jgi:hypothetical protein
LVDFFDTLEDGFACDQLLFPHVAAPLDFLNAVKVQDKARNRALVPRGCRSSTIFERCALTPLFWPLFARRAGTDDGPVIAVDQAVRGHMMISKSCSSVVGRQPKVKSMSPGKVAGPSRRSA